MNNEGKVNEFRLKKTDLMTQYKETFESIAQQLKQQMKKKFNHPDVFFQQLKFTDNPYEEQSKQNILRKDVLEFLKISQSLLNLSNDIKKHVILNDDIYQTNDECKLSEKDLLERKQNIRHSYENKQKEMEAQIKEKQTIRMNMLQQQQAINPSNQGFPPGAKPQTQQGQGQNINAPNQFQRQGQQQPQGIQQQPQQPNQIQQQQQQNQPFYPQQQAATQPQGQQQYFGQPNQNKI